MASLEGAAGDEQQEAEKNRAPIRTRRNDAAQSLTSVALGGQGL